MQRSDNLENRFKMGLGQGARCFFFVTHLFTVMYCAAPSYAPWDFDPKASTQFFYQTLLTAQCWKDSINIKWQIKSDPRTGNKGTTTQSVNKCSGLPTWKKKKRQNRKSKHSNPWEPNQAEAGVVVAEETERECVGCVLFESNPSATAAGWPAVDCKLTR